MLHAACVTGHPVSPAKQACCCDVHWCDADGSFNRMYSAHLYCSSPVSHDYEQLIQAATLQVVHGCSAPLTACRPPIRPLHAPVGIGLRHRPLSCTAHDKDLILAHCCCKVSTANRKVYEYMRSSSSKLVQPSKDMMDDEIKHTWLEIQLMVQPLKYCLSQPLPKGTQCTKVLRRQIL